MTASDQSPVPHRLEKLAEATWLTENRQPEDHENGERADLGYAEDGLDGGAEDHAANVDRGQDEDGKDGHDALRRQPELDGVRRAGQVNAAE